MGPELLRRESLTAEGIMALYADIRYSPFGSNRRLQEAQTEAWWRDFILEIEGELLEHAQMTFQSLFLLFQMKVSYLPSSLT